jgi:hypothetical protein
VDGVLVVSIAIVATTKATDAAADTTTKTSHMMAGTEAASETTHVASAAEATHVTSAAEAAATKTAAVAAATAKTSAMTATAAATTAASFGGSREQARCEKGRCQYRDRSFHHDTPVDLFGAVPRLPTSHAATERRISVR